MNSQQGGKSKSSKSSTSKSKKGGNFLGTVSELFVPSGWESFATAAGLLAIDRADAAFRRNKKSSKKMKGGVDGHESVEYMEQMMEGLKQDGEMSTPDQMNGGRKKSATKTSKKTTKKGGNFLGTVGELVAPTGWETFATTA